MFNGYGMSNAGRPRHLTIGRLLLEHPELQREIAKVIAEGIVKQSRTPSKYASFTEMRKFGSALLSLLTLTTEDSLAVFQTAGGLRLDNSWRLTALADAVQKLYPHARDALGIPALAPIKEKQGPASKPDWRKQLVDVSAQASAPPLDAREPGASVTGQDNPA